MSFPGLRPLVLALVGLSLHAAAAAGSPLAAVAPVDSVGVPAVRIAVDSVVPGAVTTSVISLPARFASDGAAPVQFRVEPLGDVRLFGSDRGTLSTAAGEDPVLLITYSVPQSQLAGHVTLARVVMQTGTTELWRAELDARVMVEPRLEMTLSSPDAAIGVGQVGEIIFAVTNLGNAADTLVIELDGETGWSMETAPGSWPIAPGQRVTGSVRVRAPENATPGDRLMVLFIARGRTAVARASIMMEVALPEQSPNYSLPLRVFTGATHGHGDGAALSGSWSISGSGEVMDGTTLTIDARSPSRIGAGSVFNREMTGPNFRATLERERWAVTAGDIFQADDAVIGAYLNGTGATGSWRSGAVTTTATLLETDVVGVSSGRLASGEVALGTPVGEFGVALRGEDCPVTPGLYSGGTLYGGALTYRGGNQATVRARANAGLVRVDGPAGVTMSPTGYVDLAHSSERGYLSLRARRAAEQAASFGGRSSELFAGGTLELGRGLAATAWYADDELGSRLPGSTGRTRAGSAGLRYTAGSVQAAVRGTSRVTNQVGVAGDDRRRDAVAVDLSGAFGRTFATLTAEHRLGGSSSLVDYLQGTLQWQTGSSWTSLTGTYAAQALTDPIVRMDLVQSVDLGRTRLDLAVGGSPTRSARETMSGWARVETEIASGTALQLGAEYFPLAHGSGSPMRFSLGISRKLSLGLPTRRPIPVSGVAFHDLNGDGVRGADEPGYAGLMLRRGRSQAITNGAGAFQLSGGEDMPLSVDAGSLGGGYIVPSRYLAMPGKGMEIPVVQAAGVAMEFFLDANGDGARGDAEAAVSGILVILEAADGTSYAETTNEAGRIEIKAMPPGTYQVRVNAGQGVQPVEVSMTLTSGTQVEQAVPLRAPTREIRFGPVAGEP